MNDTLLVTGGAGFIGSAVVRHLIQETEATVVTVDALTYAGHRENLAPVMESPRHHFEQEDITDAPVMHRLFEEHEPDGAIHLAAESHVDRSIGGPAAFVQTNVVGTQVLLEAARTYWEDQGRPGGFRFLHVSTDEVYGELGETGAFTEETPYDPSSPRIRPARPGPTTSPGRGTAPTTCRCSSRTARTTTARISTRRS